MKKDFRVVVSVLGYADKENGGWVALALEMDLRGYGDTFKDAAAELQAIIEAQVTFALQKDNLDLLDRPADAVYWQLFANTKKQEIQRAVSGKNHIKDAIYRAVGIDFPTVLAGKGNVFALAAVG